MDSETRHVLVSYDIRHPRRLARVARVMKDYGNRVLKSVFECHIKDEDLRRMKERVDKELDPVDDTVRVYILCGKCMKAVLCSGLGEEFTDGPPSWVIS